MIYCFIGFVFFIVALFVFLSVFPSKNYLNEIYMDMCLQQREQTKILKDLRNVFFAKNRKFKKEGK